MTVGSIRDAQQSGSGRSSPPEAGVTDPNSPVLIQSHLLRQQILARTLDVVAGRPDRGFQLLGRGEAAIAAGLTRLESRTHRSVRNMQRRVPFDPGNGLLELNRRSERRGLRLELIVAPSALRSNPLLTSLHPTVRTAPVALPMLLLDDRVAVVPGPFDSNGDATAWLMRDEVLLEQGRSLWSRTLALSVSALAQDSDAPLTERQCLTACMLTEGAKDSQIARRLDVSLRTVAGDVDAVATVLQASCRADLITKLSSSDI